MHGTVERNRRRMGWPFREAAGADDSDDPAGRF